MRLSSRKWPLSSVVDKCLVTKSDGLKSDNNCMENSMTPMGAQWLSGRVLDSRP